MTLGVQKGGGREGGNELQCLSCDRQPVMKSLET